MGDPITSEDTMSKRTEKGPRKMRTENRPLDSATWWPLEAWTRAVLVERAAGRLTGTGL